MVKEGSLRVWHIPQLPMNSFYVNVETVEEAMKILDILANYDGFEFINKIKPDYSNAQGLEVFENNEWSEYENDEGRNICEIIDEIKRGN